VEGVRIGTRTYLTLLHIPRDYNSQIIIIQARLSVHSCFRLPPVDVFLLLGSRTLPVPQPQFQHLSTNSTALAPLHSLSELRVSTVDSQLWTKLYRWLLFLTRLQKDSHMKPLSSLLYYGAIARTAYRIPIYVPYNVYNVGTADVYRVIT
jgi:hypothetical protein